ncbi:MAG: hypothetical protein ACOZCO_06245 [Bacteroidota bacterium]
MEFNLNLLIQSLGKEEQRHFKLSSNKYGALAGERKDIELFDYIRTSGDRYDEDKAFRMLYKNEKNKNSFYRLRNRLFSEINKSLLMLHYDESDLNIILHFIILSRLFQQKRNFKLAYHFLKKAEKKAIGAQTNELLDLIYSECIRLSNESLEINPEEYIEKRKENRNVLLRLQQIDDILSVLIYRIKVSQNFSAGNIEVLTLLNNTIKQYSDEKDIQESPAFRMRVYHALSRILLQQHDYKSLEKYLVKTFTDFSREKLFNRNNHDTKTQMLTYIANSLFKNGKFAQSLEYAEKLHDAINDFGGMVRDKYIFYYYNILVNNYGETDKRKCVDVLLEAQQNNSIKKNKFNLSFIHLQLALQYFDLAEFKNANKSLVKIKLEENFEIFDAAFQLKILIVELLVRFELEDTDYIETQVPKIKRNYKELLNKEEYHRQQLMLDILFKLITTSNPSADKPLMKKAAQLLDVEEDKATADSDLLNYNWWIRKRFGTM